MTIALLAALSSSVPIAAQAAGNACEPEILRASTSYGVPVGILYAVGLTETGRKGSLQPNAMNIEGKALFPANRTEALNAFADARRDGAKLIDIGCMQINVRYHGDQFRVQQPGGHVRSAPECRLRSSLPPAVEAAAFDLVDGGRALSCRPRQRSRPEAICVPRHCQHGGDRLWKMDVERARIL
jgi:hypothetical protein